MNTPITAFYAGLMGIGLLYLSILVIKQRRGLQVSLGDNGDSHLQAAIRAHGNYVEYVPFVLILILIAELNHANHYLLHVTGILIVVGRSLHAYGIRHHTGACWQRIWGMLMTFVALLFASILNLISLY